jgi:hypothetical protein
MELIERAAKLARQVSNLARLELQQGMANPSPAMIEARALLIIEGTSAWKPSRPRAWDE